jgi:hypothetical protein
MPWDDERAQQEYDWLRLMARFKYDGYRDFLAGARFIESLCTWLQQFDLLDREAAYCFMKTKLVYFGPAEMQRLVEMFYARHIERRLLSKVAVALQIPAYRVWAHPDGPEEMRKLRRRTLFMALSDGARLDILRHANVGVLSNEQFVVATQIDGDKWKDLVESLQDDEKDSEASFRLVYLVDDFLGTGTSFVRKDPAKGWKGKLVRFHGTSPDRRLAEGWELCVHHHIGTHRGSEETEARERLVRDEFDGWTLPPVTFSYGYLLPSDLPLTSCPEGNAGIIEIAQKYYDPAIETKHTAVGGTQSISLGYGGCALPLVLEHNTPNNSLPILWAESQGGAEPKTHAMRALFRRRQRHI